MRYGTVPVVRSVGGLKDTVVDINDNEGYGICHNGVSETSILEAIDRAKEFYKQETEFKNNRKVIMNIDNSWEVSAKAYINLYNSIT